jgi:hypothetical protein
LAAEIRERAAPGVASPAAFAAPLDDVAPEGREIGAEIGQIAAC